MEPLSPPPRGGIGIASVSHSQGGGGRTTNLSSASTMANAPLTARVAAPPTVYAAPHDPKRSNSAEEPASASARPLVDVHTRSLAADDVVRQIVMQLSDSMAASLRQVATQYGVADAVPSTAETVGDTRGVVQELTRARRRAAELQLLVDDLQTEQRVARERLALYSILALKLKRELINEKLAHIDSKKEVDEIRQHYESGGGGGGGGSSVGARSPEARSARQHYQQQQLQPQPQPAHHQPSTQRRGSYESLRGALSAEEDDPWSSPNKPTAGDTAFSRFYASSGRSTGHAQAHDDSGHTARRGDGEDDDEEDDERMMGMQPLRNSLIGQFLPSALLDSPQLTPKTRSVADTQDADHHELLAADDDETEEMKSTGETKTRDELTSSALQEKDVASCDGCGLPRAPVVELVACGHRLCRVCDRTMGTPSMDEPTSSAAASSGSTHHHPQCPRCFAAVTTPARRLDGTTTTGDNQMDHLRIETARRPQSFDSTATAFSLTPLTAGSGGSIAPLTLSLLSELFENIALDDLELFLKDASGHVSGAIERILQRHPSFNPALAAEVSVMGGHGAGASGQKGGGPGSLHRLGSSGIPSHQQQSQQQQPSGGGGGSASGNWKTEMCMYYLQGKCNKTRRTCSFAHGESDLVRTTTPKHTSSTSFKSRMCPLWLDGSCPKSRRECPLAHGENDLRDGLALLSQTAGGGASGGGGGGGVTGGGGPLQAPTLPTTAPRLQNYKTELCYYYLKGCCNFTKEECRFAHGESDLRTVESNTLEWSAQLGVAAIGDKPSMQQHQHQHQHQYQHQQPYQQQQPPPPQQHQSYVSQYQLQPPPPQPPQQQQQQPTMLHQHQQYGLTSLPAPFVPQSHQQYHPMAPPPLQSMHAVPPPGLPQGGPYGAASQHQPPFRYMKSMDDAKPPRRPAPPRRESTWSQPNYDSSLGPDF